MADPISAEPHNWGEDIILKLSMPGKELRESTLSKQKASIERYAEIKERQQQTQTQQHVTPIQEETPIQKEVVEEATVKSLDVQQDSEKISKPVQQQSDQYLSPDPNVDILSKLANPSRSAQEEWKQQMIKQTAEANPLQYKQQITKEVPKTEQAPKTFYTNYPGLTMMPTQNIWTIEPEKDDAQPAAPLSEQGKRRVESFTHRIIDSDLAWDIIKKVPKRK